MPETTPDSPTEFQLRRSIVIGLGGTGRNVCTQLKKTLRERFGSDEDAFPHIRLLSIDTDARVRTLEDEDGGNIQLAVEERMGLRLPANLGHDRLDRFIGPKIRRLLKHANDRGAKRCRPIGQAFLVTQWSEIRRKIREIYMRLHAADLSDLVRTDPRFAGRELDNARVDFYVVANLVSGTGSGMCLGMGYLLRDLIQELSQDGRTEFGLEGMFTTCGLFALADMGDRPSDYAVNCYASLLELSHYSRSDVHSTRKRRYDAGFDEVRIRDEALSHPPYDHVQLLNPSHTDAGGMGVEEFEPYISQVLALRTGSHVGMTASAKIVDELSSRPMTDPHGNERFCWAWGANSFRSSGKEILDLAALLAAERVLDSVLGTAAAAEEDAQRIATSFGLGGSSEAPPLLSSLLTPTESVEGGSAGVSLEDSIETLVRQQLPTPVDDRDVVRSLLHSLDNQRLSLLEKTRALIQRVCAENRRALAEQVRDSVFQRLEELADAGAEPPGALRRGLSVLDRLAGRQGAQPGLLHADQESLQRGARAQQKLQEDSRSQAERSAQAVLEIAQMGRGFTHQALLSAWQDLIEATVRTLRAEARLLALREARRLLEGDDQDRQELLRLGLIKSLEQLHSRWREATESIGAHQQTVQQRQQAVARRLAEGRRGVEKVQNEARELASQALAGGKLQRAVQEWLQHTGAPFDLGRRYVKHGLQADDLRALERLSARRVEEVGQDRLLRSLEEDPTLGGALPGHLERSAPAIRLNRDLERSEQVAFLSLPDGASNFRKTLLEDDWLQYRRGVRAAEQLLEERPKDADPRIDVLTATLPFSPAAIVGINDWADRYRQATQGNPDALRAVHTIADASGGRQLIFEPLGTTRSRIEVGYLLGLGFGWLREESGIGAYVYVKDHGGDLVTTEKRISLECALDEPRVLRELQRPMASGVNDATLRLPIFMHILQRFQGELEKVKQPLEHPLWPRLVAAVGRLVREELPEEVLPRPSGEGQDFEALQYALRCLLEPWNLWQPLMDAMRSGASPPPPPPEVAQCSNGHPVLLGQAFCGNCGQPVASARSCPRCQLAVPAQSRFCGTCGWDSQGSAGA